MAGLSYVGKPSSDPGDVTTRAALNAALAAVTPSQGSVQAQIDALNGATYATKSYVDTLNATFETPDYYEARDALNLPNVAVGLVISTSPLGSTSYYGAASLDGSGKIPIAQMPAAGAGYLMGGWGPTATATGSTGSTPIKIADWNIGRISTQVRPWVFLNAFIQGSVSGATTSHPVIEIRIANTTTAPTYAATTLVSMGEGRTYYGDYHAICAVPVPETTGETPTLLASSYNIWLTAWLYDLNGSSVTLSTGGIASAPAYFWRGAL